MHKSVLLEQAVEYLNIKPDGTYVDGTLGGAGHAQAILARLSPAGLFIGMDRDPDAIERGRKVLRQCTNVRLVHENFSRMREVLHTLDVVRVDGILLDLGVSSFQIDTPGRGFSYLQDVPLDMRMNPGQRLSAFLIVNEWSKEQLADTMKAFGEEPLAPRIAERIVTRRLKKGPITTTGDLTACIHSAAGKGKRGMVAVKRVFQALRIAVNGELAALEAFLESIPRITKPGARIVILSFHSLEDRMVKHYFSRVAHPCTCPPSFPQCTCGKKPELLIITKKAVTPTEEEIAGNPRAKSAKMRVAERI